MLQPEQRDQGLPKRVSRNTRLGLRRHPICQWSHKHRVLHALHLFETGLLRDPKGFQRIILSGLTRRCATSYDYKKARCVVLSDLVTKLSPMGATVEDISQKLFDYVIIGMCPEIIL